MPDESSLSKILSGVAGEYFVAAELSRRGYIASITLKNTRGVDLLAANATATKSTTIQVKTNQGRKKKWILDHKAETDIADNLVYVFVNLKGLKELPDYHIVPSALVAEYCKRTHAEWLAKPGRKGQLHNDGKIRNFDDHSETYLSRWEILGLD